VNGARALPVAEELRDERASRLLVEVADDGELAGRRPVEDE
jgi:hypothetical protein